MVYKLSPIPIVFFATISICMNDSVQAAGSRPPAGQMCAEGSFVSGFDSEGNIICSVPGGASLPVADEPAKKTSNQVEDKCSPGCQKATADTGAADTVQVADKLEKSKDTVVDAAKPVISDVKPSWVVFGARETSIAIIGAGFTHESVVKFQDSTYSPSVNPSGTELRVTIATRNLPIGRYAITVSNGPGQETTQNRALEVY